MYIVDRTMQAEFFYQYDIESVPKKWNWPRNMVLTKNPQFLPNCLETWSKNLSRLF